ncbi:MAG: UDP-N-acetylglucosamine 1-carboxyvinyltransferase [Chloroflexota bacterium]|nr:UDP-N-acetylglucosamine 1-carboxyvinyltransferase [Chloroflexota bacterium]
MLIQIEGGHPLNGTYHPGGNPNAAIALMAAALLTEAPVALHNVPDTVITRTLAGIARDLGAQVAWSDGDMTLTSAQIARRTLSSEETDRSVGTLLLLAPLLARRHHARLECDFPLNRIRTHLEALRDLGIDVITGSGAVDFKASRWEKRDILLSGASVTATALVMMLAASLGRETVVHNAAAEPHIRELAALLTAMGAPVEGAGSNVLTIYGTQPLIGAEVTVGAHYVEAGSIAAMTAICGGRVEIIGALRTDMRMIARIFGRFGVQFDVGEAALYVPHHDGLTISNREEDVDGSIESAPWPGFPSDLVAVATVVATQAVGTALIHEKMFANRLLFIDKLKAMGAQIVLCDPHRAIVVGASKLHGTYMDTPDIRAGLGMVAAALTADGVTQIDNAQVLSHTFGDVLGKLRALGARIETS